MGRYVVLVVDDNEGSWETRTPEEQQDTFDHDYRFGALLEQRGGRITGGAALTHSRETRVLRRPATGTAIAEVTEGPFAETVEQLSGFFLVEADRIEDLTEASREFFPAHARIEIRPIQEF